MEFLPQERRRRTAGRGRLALDVVRRVPMRSKFGKSTAEPFDKARFPHDLVIQLQCAPAPVDQGSQKHRPADVG